MTTLDTARARHLDALHAVVSAAMAYYLHYAPLPGTDGAALTDALLAEAKAANAVTAAIRDNTKPAQLRLEDAA